MKKLLAALVLSLSVQAAQDPAQLKLEDGRAFDAWIIAAETAATVTVRHKGGMAKVDKKLLPPELRAKYPHDAARLKKEEEAAADEREKKARAGKLLRAEWKQVESFSGSGPQRSKNFVVSKDTWRVTTTMGASSSGRSTIGHSNPFVSVQVQGEEKFLAASMDKVGTTTSYGKTAGSYFVVVTAFDVPWTVTVEELR